MILFSMVLPMLPFILLMAIIGIIQCLINFEDRIINPITKGNYVPIIIFIIYIVIIFAFIGWFIILRIQDNYQSKLNILTAKQAELERDYKQKL